MDKDSVTILYNTPKIAYILKRDKRLPWANNDCSDKTILKCLKREKDVVKRVQFVDHHGLADGIRVHF